jgi:recombinational DNA repair protein RecT
MVYAVAQLVGGSGNDTEWCYMTSPQIRRIQSRSPAGGSGPWVTDWEEMAKKTVIRRLFKLLPLTNEVAKAVEIGADEDREGIDFGVVAAAASAVADEQEEGKLIEMREAPAPRDGGAELAEAVRKVAAKKAAREAAAAEPADGKDPQGSLV